MKKMKFLIEPRKGIWVASKLSKEELQKKIIHADVCISDLDDTDASSPAKRLALDNFRARFFQDKNYRSWIYRCLRAKLNREGKKADSHLWQEYVRDFLPKIIRQEIIENKFPPERVRELLYPGVAKFYSLLEARKYYVSRNIAEVVQQFGSLLGFDECFGEQYDKWKFMEHFVSNHPQFRRYLIRGDSKEDEKIKGYLESCVRSRKIDYHLSLYQADRPLKEPHGFDVETGKDLEGLVEVVWGKG